MRSLVRVFAACPFIKCLLFSGEDAQSRPSLRCWPYYKRSVNFRRRCAFSPVFAAGPIIKVSAIFRRRCAFAQSRQGPRCWPYYKRSVIFRRRCAVSSESSLLAQIINCLLFSGEDAHLRSLARVFAAGPIIKFCYFQAMMLSLLEAGFLSMWTSNL